MNVGSWTDLDYLLHGEFCPAEEILPALEDLRRAVGGRSALLLVAGSRGLLRTLCTYGSADDSGDLVRRFLRSGPQVVLRRKRERVTLPDDNTVYRPSDPRWLPKSVVERITGVADGHGIPDVARALGDPNDWVAVAMPAEMGRMSMTVAAFVCGPAQAPLVDAGGERVIECRDAMLRLGVMTSTTANTSVYQDTMITTRVDEKLSHQNSENGDLNLQRTTEDLVKLAAEVTRSAAVGYYLTDPVAGVLERIATYIEPGRRVSFPRELEGDSPRGAAMAVRRRRPLAHGWEGSRGNLEATLRADEGELDRFVEMSTPVPGPLASPRVACAGVLTVLRLADGDGVIESFGAYDHSLLRNVALRLALLHATEDMEAAADMFRELTIRESDATVGFRATVSARTPAIAPGGHPIPDDVADALPPIEDALEDVARLTGSHSATFRVALPAKGAGACHGLVLVRVAARSKDGLLDKRPVQDVTQAGVNCRAVLTGSAQNVPYVSKDKNYDAVREKTMSEISVPVSVEGMVVGVVNLESPIERNYDARVSTAIAFAEHVGMAIADARLALSRELHQYATRIVRRGHDISAEAKAITKATRWSRRKVRVRVAEALDSIEGRARGIRQFDPEADSRKPADFQSLADEARRDASIAFIDSHVDPGQGGREFNQPTTQILYECLRHVFVNVQEHTPIDADALPRMELKGAVWGGRRYQVLNVENEAVEDLDPARAVNFYRVPVVDRRRRSDPSGAGEIEVPRFGAYLAGNQARSIGGSVHMHLEESNQVRVTVMVPQPLGGTADA